MHTIASANVLKKITCFKKQKFNLNQFKLLPSTGLSYSSAAPPCKDPVRKASRGRYSTYLPHFRHDPINCSQNTRLNSVILGLSLENSHGRLCRKFRKKRTYNDDYKP